MLSLIAEFVFKLLSGEVWSVYQKYKLYEATEAQNKIAGMSPAAVDDKLQQWTIKP